MHAYVKYLQSEADGEVRELDDNDEEVRKEDSISGGSSMNVPRLTTLGPLTATTKDFQASV